MCCCCKKNQARTQVLRTSKNVFGMGSCFCCSILFSQFSSGLTKTGSKHADFLKQRRKLSWNAKKKHVNFTLFWETQHLSKNNVKPSQTSDSFYTRSLSKGCSFLPFLFLPSDFFPLPLSPLLSPFDVRQTWEFEVKWLQCYRPREGGKKN